MVCIRIRERGSRQDGANVYESLYIYRPWALEISANQQVIQASNVTKFITIDHTVHVIYSGWSHCIAIVNKILR
jgi:hypothetical protein